MKWKEAVYIILDEIKLFSDDATYTEEHVMFLLSKYRAYLLKKKYEDEKDEVPDSLYQTICLDVEETDAISGQPCEGEPYLKSTVKVPDLLDVGTAVAYPVDFYQGVMIAFINKFRMRYVGHNKYLRNIIYASMGPDNYIYLKSANPQFLYLEKIRLTGVFENADEAAELQCDTDSEENTSCDTLEKTFPIEDALVPELIELVLKELLGAAYRPRDTQNNAKDDLSDVVTKQE